MLKRHEVQVLRRAGHSLREVAEISGVSARTVRRVADEGAVTTIDNTAERTRRQVGRPSKAEAYREVVERALTEDATLRSVELLHRARQAGYTGGKSALYDLVRGVRPHTVHRWSDLKDSRESFRSMTSAKCGSPLRTARRRRCISLRRV